MSATGENEGKTWSVGRQIEILNQVARGRAPEKLSFECRYQGSEKALSRGKVSTQQERQEGTIQGRRDALARRGTKTPEGPEWKDQQVEEKRTRSNL